MTAALGDLLRHDALRRLAGDRSYGYGREYFERDQVYGLKDEEGVLTAKVLGLYTYHVRLWTDGAALGHACTCPMGRREKFCKHGVAVALAWLDRTGIEEAPSASRLTIDPKETIRAYLGARSTGELIDIIIQQAADERFRGRLLLRIARTDGGEPDLALFRRIIDTATNPGEGVDERAYAARIDDVASSLSDLLNDGFAAEMLGLIEYLLDAIERTLASVDDPEHQMDEVLYHLQELHLSACRAAKPEPGKLAGRLFEWRLDTRWDVFYDVMATYADVLGEGGLAVYRALAEKEWARVPALGPGEENPDRYGRRLRLTYIMETIARQSGDIDAVAAVKSRDLTRAYTYLEIARLYKQAGRDDEALEWAERGREAFADRPDAELLDFLSREYKRRGRA